MEDQEMLNKISESFMKIAVSLPNTFCLEDEVLKPRELSQPNIFLPLFLNKANKYYQEIFKKDLPIEYVLDDEAVCTCVPVIISQDNNIFSNYIYFLHFTIDEYIKEYSNPLLLVDGAIPLNKLFFEFEQDLINRKLKLRKKILQDMVNKASGDSGKA